MTFNSIYKQIFLSPSQEQRKKPQELWLPFPQFLIFEQKEKFDMSKKKNSGRVLEITFKYKHNMN